MTMGYNTVILIPAYNPDIQLINLVDELKHSGFHRIVVVNDGSGEEKMPVFKKLKEKVYLIINERNMGKGAALKRGFTYILNELRDCEYVITMDADGQHKPVDILQMMKHITNHPSGIFLGRRTFSEANVPARSRVGNAISQKLFKLFTGVNVYDTQTGLRAFPVAVLNDLLQIEGDRFEYEMNVLLMCTAKKIMIIEIPIETIYNNGNKSSHYSIVVDSAKILFCYIKFFFKYKIGKYRLGK